MQARIYNKLSIVALIFSILGAIALYFQKYPYKLWIILLSTLLCVIAVAAAIFAFIQIKKIYQHGLVFAVIGATLAFATLLGAYFSYQWLDMLSPEEAAQHMYSHTANYPLVAIDELIKEDSRAVRVAGTRFVNTEAYVVRIVPWQSVTGSGFGPPNYVSNHKDYVLISSNPLYNGQETEDPTLSVSAYNAKQLEVGKKYKLSLKIATTVPRPPSSPYTAIELMGYDLAELEASNNSQSAIFLPQTSIPADWKTYRNDIFEFKYPSNWNFVVGEGGSYLSFSSTNSTRNGVIGDGFVIYWWEGLNPSRLNLQEYVTKKLTAYNKIELKINGRSVIKFRRPENGFFQEPYPVVQYFFLNESKDIVIQLETPYREGNDLNAIIASFKFTK